jgi:hypothetical protein
MGRKEVSMAPAVLTSDTDIWLNVSKRALRATGYLSLRAVKASVSGRVVILQGRVPTYYMKQLAQAAAMDVADVRERTTTWR